MVTSETRANNEQPLIGGSLIRAAHVRYMTYRLMTVPCSSPEFLFTTMHTDTAHG